MFVSNVKKKGEKNMENDTTEKSWKKCAKCGKMDCELRFDTLEKEWRCRECYYNKKNEKN